MKNLNAMTNKNAGAALTCSVPASMTDAPSVFEFEGSAVRVVMIDGEPWFVLKDVCKVLEYTNHKMVAERLDEDEVKKAYPIVDTLGRLQNTTIVSEAGLYSVIMRSNKPEAKAFKRWVTHEVLPSIRRTQMYIGPTPDYSKLLADNAFIESVLVFIRTQNAENEALRIENTVQREEIARLEPQARYCAEVLRSAESVPITVIAKEYGMSGIAMNRLLHDLRVQYMCRGTWVLYQQYADCGYTQTETYAFTHTDGTPDTRIHTYWTQAGKRFLVDLLAGEGILPNRALNDATGTEEEA